MRYKDPNGKIPLTKKQEQVYALMADNPGCIVHLHKKMTGTVCYRLRTTTGNPITNVTCGVIHQLAEKEYIKKNDEGFYIVA